MCQLFKLFEIGQFKNCVRQSMGFCHTFHDLTVTGQGACLTNDEMSDKMNDKN